MTSQPLNLPQREVCPWLLRRKFNEGQYVERAARSELVAIVSRRWLTPAERNQVAGTVTEKVEYSAPEGERLAIALQFVQPNGRLGASGRPDPKWLREGGENLIPSHRDDEVCPDCPADRRSRLSSS